MSDEINFKIGDEAVKTIIELRDQEPGEKEYALFLQIDGVHGNQFTYDLSFLDVEQARSDDKRVDFGDLVVIVAAKDIDKFDRNGYQSLFWETTCILNGTPIQVLQLAISGNDSLYHIRKLWQFKVSDSDYSDWKEQMIQISVCDTRKKHKMKHPCPSFK